MFGVVPCILTEKKSNKTIYHHHHLIIFSIRKKNVLFSVFFVIMCFVCLQIIQRKDYGWQPRFRTMGLQKLHWCMWIKLPIGKKIFHKNILKISWNRNMNEFFFGKFREIDSCCNFTWSGALEVLWKIFKYTQNYNVI